MTISLFDDDAPTPAELEQPKKEKKRPDLGHHIGSATLYRHGLMRSFLYTEGVQDLAEQAGAYWLIDLAASHQTNAKVRREPFQLWSLRMLPADAENMAVAEARTDTNGRVLCKQLIPYTDFPMEVGETFEWYVTRNEHGHTMMLKSEY